MSDEPALKPLPDPASYKLSELIEEMQTTFKERDEFIKGRLQLKKIPIEIANLQRYRLGRLVAIERLLKALPGAAAVTGYIAAADPRLEEQEEDVEDTIGDHTPEEGMRAIDSLPSSALPKSPNIDYDEVERLYNEKVKADDAAMPEISDADAERILDEKQHALDAEIAADNAADNAKPPAEEVEW